MDPEGCPAHFCDLVMKGGITSGIVYPRAVTEIAKQFTLKSVGGTSAGAIAAAAAAAAELGRQRRVPGGGFGMLAELPDFLCKANANGESNLFAFFQPERSTRRIFRVLTSALNCRSKGEIIGRVLWMALRVYWPGFVAGALPGAGLALLAMLAIGLTLPGMVFFLVGIGIALAGAMMGMLGLFLMEFQKAVPRNFYGVCSGMPSEAQKGPGPALTEWLHGYINQLAGLNPEGPPLTFGNLWDPEVSSGEQPKAAHRLVNLEMMTTCVTWGRPFRLPFQNEESVRNNRFYFRRDEFARLFPAAVVEWLEQHGRESSLPQKWRDQAYVPLPEPWNLPVVVATRMSLSFPVLLSAIPLYSYPQKAADQQRAQEPPRRCWFSDGGICSNFPMHFFDSPMPRWPTFAINLVERPSHTPREELAVPWMPVANNEGIAESWDHLQEQKGLASVAAFVSAILKTMQNWSDNTLSHLPGYRDRIAHVGLTPEEGGLNLDMPAARIRDLCDRGTAAGREFVRRFATDQEPVMNWSNHRWLRLRSIMASLEELVRGIDLSCAQPQAADTGYQDWLEKTALGQAPSYQWVSDPQRQLAIEMLDGLRDLAAMIQSESASLETKAPRPRPELRARPRL